jgi:hypothetical protein
LAMIPSGKNSFRLRVAPATTPSKHKLTPYPAAQ